MATVFTDGDVVREIGRVMFMIISLTMGSSLTWYSILFGQFAGEAVNKKR
jgi:hypothetical protein